MMTIVFDQRPDYLRGESASLLTLPAGPRSLLDHMAAGLGLGANDPVTIVAPVPRSSEYVRRLSRSTQRRVTVIRPSEIASHLSECESHDYVCVADAGNWPVNGFRLGDVLESYADYRGAKHLVAIGDNADRVCEPISHNGDGLVTGVYRMFQSVTWPDVATTSTFVSLVPGVAAAQVAFQSLTELRAALSRKGVLSTDVPAAANLAHLHDERAVLALNERAMDMSNGAFNGTADRRARPILVGRGHDIAETVRFVGSVLIHDDVTIERAVTVIGPTVIGRGSHIGSGALVAQSIVAPETRIFPDVQVCHRVASDHVVDRLLPPTTAKRLAATGLPPMSSRMGLAVRATRSAVRQRRAYDVTKRALDIVLSALGLIVQAPLLVLLAILIKIDSRGPVFFSHTRENGDGVEFPCIKFRTMVADAHKRQRELFDENEIDGPQFKIADDPRVTRLGRFLRRTNLDEMPQLFNVLMGHMSLVGPRPSPFRENQVCVPWRRARLSVRPGITGLWQICRDDGEGGDFHQWIYYDLAYVRHRSLMLDVKVLLGTVLTLGGRWVVPINWFISEGRLSGDEESDPHRAMPPILAEIPLTG